MAPNHLRGSLHVSELMTSGHCPREVLLRAWEGFLSFPRLCSPCWVSESQMRIFGLTQVVVLLLGVEKYNSDAQIWGFRGHPGPAGEHRGSRGSPKQAEICRTIRHMGQQKGELEGMASGGTIESSQAAECSGIASAECSFQYVAAIGAGKVGLRSQLDHMLATHIASLKFLFSVPVLQDECQGSLRAGEQRAQHSAWHTGGPQLVWPPSLSTSLPGLPP